MELHIITYNIHKGVGWRKGHLTLDDIYQQLRILHPDIIFLQEVRGCQFDKLPTEIWPHYSYGKNVIYTAGHHGNAILSKFPLQMKKNIDLTLRPYQKRGLLYSNVRLPGSKKTLHLLCAHLGLFKIERRKQLEKILKFILTLPPHEPLILAGDFNDWTQLATEPFIHTLKLQEVFLARHGTYARTFPAWAPLLKLDRIYLRHFHINQANILMHSAWRTLSDHIALEARIAPDFF